MGDNVVDAETAEAMVALVDQTSCELTIRFLLGGGCGRAPRDRLTGTSSATVRQSRGSTLAT